MKMPEQANKPIIFQQSNYEIGLGPSPPPSVRKLVLRHTGRLRKRDNLLTGEGEGGGRGAESYDGEKAGYSIKPSILSVKYVIRKVTSREIKWMSSLTPNLWLKFCNGDFSLRVFQFLYA
jgi:hypothetical protein